MNGSEIMMLNGSESDFLQYRLKTRDIGKSISAYNITIEEFLFPNTVNQFKEHLDKHFDAQNSKYNSEVFYFIYYQLMAAYEMKYRADLKFDLIEKFFAFILQYEGAAPIHVTVFTKYLIEISNNLFGNIQTRSELSSREPNVDLRKYFLTNVGTRHELLFSLLEFYFDLTDHLTVFATIDCVNFVETFISNVPLNEPVVITPCLGIKFDQLVPFTLRNGKAGLRDVFHSPEDFTAILANRLNNELDTKNDLMKFFKNGDMDMKNIEVVMMMNNNSKNTISYEIVANEQTIIFIDRIFISPQRGYYNNWRRLTLPPAAAFDFYSKDFAQMRCGRTVLGRIVLKLDSFNPSTSTDAADQAAASVAPKRQRSEEELIQQQNLQPKTKLPKQDARVVRKPYSEVARKPLVKAIIDRSVDDGAISHEKWMMIRQGMLGVYWKILEENPGPSPQIDDSGWYQGHVKLLTCTNERSASLLNSAIASLGELWPGAKLDVIPVSDIPRRPRSIAVIPAEPHDPDEVLKYIKSGNPDIPTDNWKVVKVCAPEGANRKVVVVLNKESLAPLREKQSRIYYGFDSIKLRIYRGDDKNDLMVGDLFRSLGDGEDALLDSDPEDVDVTVVYDPDHGEGDLGEHSPL